MQCGRRAKGPRVYDWAVVEIRPLRERGRGYWLLARRSLADPREVAYYVCMDRAEQRWRNWPEWPGPGGP